uniref:Mff-like domain-containing protein n=1 Tax=Timema tahoe TaxID=61484 RepID=A0A7R9FKP8_9NEOP|nr:unnamed protein product [Timema tahoe]
MARQQEKDQKEKDKVVAAKKKRKAIKHDTSSETEEEDEWTNSEESLLSLSDIDDETDLQSTTNNVTDVSKMLILFWYCYLEKSLITSQDQHFGTRAPPRELLLENSIMPSDPGSVRVATPPRVITLDEHYFPTADEYMSLPPAPEPTHEEMTAIVKPKPRFNVDHRMHVRESTPPLSTGDSLTTNEEITHLRRQMAKMNRRMMALELDSLQRQQREKFLYAVGLAYFLLKTVLWLGRS